MILLSDNGRVGGTTAGTRQSRDSNHEGKLSDSITLGLDTVTQEEVLLGEMDRRQGLYVIGKNGTGKTSLIRDLILQDMKAGYGICVLDPHGDLIDDLLAEVPENREADVILLDPRESDNPFGLNLYECDDLSRPELVARISGQVVELFQKFWGKEGTEGTSWGPQVAQVFRNTALTIIANPGCTMADVPLLLMDEGFRRKLTANVTNPQVQLFWDRYNRRRLEKQEEYTSSTINKLDEFLSQAIVYNIVGQNSTTIDFREVMDSGKILLVRLGSGRLGHSVVQLLGSVIVFQVLNAALSREELRAQSRRQFNLYADEYHRFATPTFADLLAEARKYAIATTVAHQYRWQLDEKNQGASLNAGNLVVFSVLGEDAEELAKEFDAAPPEPEVIGQTEIRKPTQDPVSHLAQKGGHEDRKLARFAQNFLEPLLTFASELEGREVLHTGEKGERLHTVEKGERCFIRGRGDEPMPKRWRCFPDRGIYYTSRRTFREGLRKINRYLVGMMDAGPGISFDEWLRLLWEPLVELRAYFGLADYEVNGLAFAPSHECTEYLLETERMEVPLPAKSAEKLQEAILAFLGGDQRKKEKSMDVYRDERASYWKRQLESLVPITRPDLVDLMPKLAMDRAVEEAVSAAVSIEGLIYLGERLAEEPILVGTGRWEPIYDRPRPYSDVKNEIATRLVNLPNFRARAKLRQGGAVKEFELETPRHRETKWGPEVEERIELIRSRSRALYCRPRREVEEEIRERQRGEDNPPATQRIAPV